MYSRSATLCTHAIVTSNGSTFKSNNICVLLKFILTRQQATNQIISSIAMNGLALSHILNTEGEKIQYILGTLPTSEHAPPTIKDILMANKSVTEMLNTVVNTQILLGNKFIDVLSD
ncbi:MAG: hypothetical protein FWE05_09335 [Defluviitaleaceae bacterium]|nr:hypothetical protein [Defluviitaleaceae bacterium]